MTQLQMERAARAAGAQPRAIALYRSNRFTSTDISPFALAAIFSGLAWMVLITRTIFLFA